MTTSARDRLASYLVQQVRENGLVDVKFFPTTDSNATVEQCAEAILQALTNPTPVAVDHAWDSEPF